MVTKISRLALYLLQRVVHKWTMRQFGHVGVFQKFVRGMKCPASKPTVVLVLTKPMYSWYEKEEISSIEFLAS
jgi:hypothetical protein